MNKKYFLLFLLINLNLLYSQTTIKTLFYNLLNYPTAPPNDRNIILKDILNIYEPDLFMVCELESEVSGNDILYTSLSEINKNYNKAQFIINQSDDDPFSSLQQMIYYNEDYFILESQEVILTYVRDINHYTFILKTDDYLSNPIYLEVYVTHLKSSSGTANQQLRLHMVEEFVNSLAGIDPDSFVIFAGDFNFYSSSESGYQKILDNSNTIIMKDLLNPTNILQSWHNNVNWRDLHTQSTRLSNSGFGGYGAGGGFDDRFDFIMLSENMLSNTNLQYVPNSYKSYGNNGNCYNLRIDDNSCTGEFSQELRNKLYSMSDHLPVILSLETNKALANTDALIESDLVKFTHGNTITNDLTLHLNNLLLNNKLTIYNYLGQKVIEKQIKNTTITIDFSFLSKGVYNLKIQGFNKSFKIIKI